MSFALSSSVVPLLSVLLWEIFFSSFSALNPLWSCCLNLKLTRLDEVHDVLQVSAAAPHLFPQLCPLQPLSAIGEGCGLGSVEECVWEQVLGGKLDIVTVKNFLFCS